VRAGDPGMIPREAQQTRTIASCSSAGPLDPRTADRGDGDDVADPVRHRLSRAR
jgi:hypothetical protein